MSKEILIVKNISREGPGLLEELLVEQGTPYKIVDLDAGQEFPSPVDYKALVVLGGPDSANDTTPKMQTELARINEAIDAGLPYLGICLGLQTLVKARGGAVVKNAVREIGFRDPDGQRFSVELTEAGRVDPLFKDLGDSFEVFHLHGEIVEPTADMVVLATGKFCKNQIVKVGAKAYGIQCHFELTPEMFITWAREDPDLKQLSVIELNKDFEATQMEYNRVGRQLLQNFLTIVGQ